MKQFKVFSLYFFLIVNMFSGLSVNAKSIVAADIVEGQQYVPNFLKNKSHLEKNANGITAYADAAGTRPVDGTGGAPTLTCTRTTSSALDGDGSLLITKAAADKQGQGCGIQFTIDSAYKAKVLQIEMDYIVASGTFSAGSSTTDSDLIVYMYDVTNSTLIEPSSIKFLASSTTLPDKFVANFQTSATGTTYNLILHQATTSASAYTFKADNIQVKPSQYVYGTPITDWVAYTPTGSWSTNTTYTGRWRRVGDTLEAQINLLLTGAPTAADLTVNFLPAGLSVDSSKMASFSFGSVGDANIIDSGTRVYIANPAFNGGSFVYLVHTESGNTGIVNATNPTTFASADNIRMNLRFPISGWSSSTQMSDSYDGRSIVFVGKNSASTSMATTGTYIPFTSQKDSTGSWSTDTFTCPSAGDYEVIAGLHGSSASNYFYAQVDKNGTLYARILQNESRGDRLASGSVIVYNCNAGDTIKLKGYSDTSSQTLNASADLNYITISKKQSPTTISATARLSARYTTAAGQSIPNTATNTIVDFGTKDWDDFGSVTTGASWRFTANIAGDYNIYVMTHYSASAWSAGNAAYGSIFKNGSVYCTFDDPPIWASTTDAVPVKGKCKVRMNANDYIDIQIANTRTAGATTLTTSAALNYVEIELIK